MESHKNENPLKTLQELNDILQVVREGKLEDLEDTIVAKLEETQVKLEKDITDAVAMKETLGSDNISEITDAAQRLMKNGNLLADQVSDYKSLCEALTERNKQLVKDFSAMKARNALLESKDESSNLEKNQRIVALSDELDALKESYDELDTKAGDEVISLRESIKQYSRGNALLEKKLGVAETKYTELKEKAKKVSESYLKLSDEYEVLSDRYSRAKALLKEAQNNDNYINEINSLKEANNELKAELRNAKALREELSALKDKNAKLQSKLVESEAEVSNKEKELRSVKFENSKLTEAIEKMELQNAKKVTETKNVEKTVTPVETPKVTIKESKVSTSDENLVASRENGIDSFWNDLHNKYGESIEKFEKNIHGAKTLREAQLEWFKVRELVDANLAIANNASIAGRGQMSESQEKKLYENAGMDVNGFNGVDSVEARYQSQMNAFGLL